MLKTDRKFSGEMAWRLTVLEALVLKVKAPFGDEAIDFSQKQEHTQILQFLP